MSLPSGDDANKACINDSIDRQIDAWQSKRAPNEGLPSQFYSDPKIFAVDLERVLLPSWVFAGHVSMLPEKGSFFTCEVANESAIIVRDRDDAIRALANVCRHRGSRICDASRGRVNAFTCPYHGWTYGLDGHLRAAATTGDKFNNTDYGLLTLGIEIIEGLIFIRFLDGPVGLRAAGDALKQALSRFHLEKAKVAHHSRFSIAANWKLTAENYLECYHCPIAHPEYAARHANAVVDRNLADLQSALQSRMTELGFSSRPLEHYGDSLKTGEQNFRVASNPLKPTQHTGSRDGKKLGPNFGGLPDMGGVYTDILVGPLSYFLLYQDHLLCFRVIPRAAQQTDFDAFWLVPSDADSEAKYDIDELTWFWTVTTQQDKQIIERNQAGVNSRLYRPGPYSPRERLTLQLVEWYLDALSASSSDSALSSVMGR